MIALGKTDRIDEWVKARMAHDHIPAMAVGIYRDGKPIKVKAYGTIDLEHNAPARLDSPYEIGSITKQFVAVAVLMLVDEGKLSLDDPLTKYFPNADPSWKEVKVVDALQHISGLPDPFTSIDVFAQPWESILKDYVKQKAVAPPRTAWIYNNGGYAIMENIVEQVSGEPMWSYVKRRVFDPLGMKHTFPNSPVEQKGRVRGYVWDGKEYVNQPPLDGGSAAGGLVSTTDDLMRWSQALLKGTLLKPESRAAMLRPARLVSGEAAYTEIGGGYGLGVFLDERDGRAIEFHSGGWAGASAQLTRIPGEKLTIVVLSNAGSLDERPWWGEEIAEIVTGQPYLPTYDIAPDPDPARTAKARAIIEKDQAADPKAPKMTSFGFVRAVPQGEQTFLLYRAEVDKPLLAVFSQCGEALELVRVTEIPPSYATKK